MVEQPYQYQRRELAEPDWRRLPGWAGVTREEWESAQWQRAHSVKNARQLRDVTGGGLSEAFLADLERDQRERATMSMLLPPQMLNTIAPSVAALRPPGSPTRGTPTRCAGTCCRCSATGSRSGRRTRTRRGTRCTRRRCGRSRG